MGTTRAIAGSPVPRSMDAESAVLIRRLQVQFGVIWVNAGCHETVEPILALRLRRRFVRPLAASQPGGRVREIGRIVGELMPLQSGDDGLRRRAVPHPPRENSPGIVLPGLQRIIFPEVIEGGVRGCATACRSES